MTENPYLIFCPECGKTICYVCAKIDDNIAAEVDGYGDVQYIRRQSRRRKRHLEAYDHAFVGANDHSVLVMRMG